MYVDIDDKKKINATQQVQQTLTNSDLGLTIIMVGLKLAEQKQQIIM